MRRPASALAAALLFVAAAPALALEVPALDRRVTDRAQILTDAQRTQLTAKLELYQRESAHQFALLTIPSLEGEVLEDYSIEVVEAWQLGASGFDNGLLILVSKNDRKIRIEVGEGLEGVVTDALSSRIIREVIVPAFRAGDFSGGLSSAFDLLMKAGLGEPVDFEEAWGNQNAGRSTRSDSSFIAIIFFVLLVIIIASIFGGGGGGGYGRRRFGSSYGGYGSFGGGGGFSSGGGFSGGGGSFGGGGASGSW